MEILCRYTPTRISLGSLAPPTQCDDNKEQAIYSRPLQVCPVHGALRRWENSGRAVGALCWLQGLPPSTILCRKGSDILYMDVGPASGGGLHPNRNLTWRIRSET